MSSPLSRASSRWLIISLCRKSSTGIVVLLPVLVVSGLYGSPDPFQGHFVSSIDRPRALSVEELTLGGPGANRFYEPSMRLVCPSRPGRPGLSKTTGGEPPATPTPSWLLS